MAGPSSLLPLSELESSSLSSTTIVDSNAAATELSMYQNLRRLINVVDELRDVGLQQYINLPRICVVGTQSAGKSSVLEAIVGIDFLPRGEGVVTRRPLELRLVHLSETEHRTEESWAIFDVKKDQKFTNYREVRQMIDQLTEEVAGVNKGIVDNPIVLTIYGTQCPDLTIIDLPGITRVPLKGSDQTDDIEKLTRDMALRYARDPRTIVLAVVPANADMSTSDALQLARRVDPKGVRTIGVITKVDLMDRGTDASRMLSGDEVPLRLGYTGVRNRSQADIKANKSIRDAVQDERAFFQNHPIYKMLPKHMLGTQALIEKLTKVLFRHIKTYLPEIKREISNRMRALQLRLDELGAGVPIEPSERVQLMWGLITDYCEVFRNTIRGKFDKKLQIYFERQDITSGAQIRAIFNELLEEYVQQQVTLEMSDYDIDLAIRMHEGDSLPGFPSPDTFEYLILPHLRKIQAPVFDCLDRVGQSLELLSQKIANRVFGRFPSLSEQVLELSSNILLREKENTKMILENVVTAETGYLFTNDSSYLTQHGSMIPMTHDKAANNAAGSLTNNSVNGNSTTAQLLDASGRPIGGQAGDGSIGDATNSKGGYGLGGSGTAAAQAGVAYGHLQASVANMWGSAVGAGDKSKKTRYSASFIKEIRERLDAYFNIVLRNVRDSVPKIIGAFLVRQLQDKMQFELYNDLNRAEKIAGLLGEPPHIMEERKTMVDQMDTLRKASQVLQRDPHIAALAVNEFDELYDSDLAQLHQTLQATSISSTSAVMRQSGGQNKSLNSGGSVATNYPMSGGSSSGNFSGHQQPHQQASSYVTQDGPQTSGGGWMGSFGGQQARQQQQPAAPPSAAAASSQTKKASLAASLFGGGGDKTSKQAGLFDSNKKSSAASSNPLFG